MKQKKASVVIVGRPNVGKSTLFNRITGRRDAIVDDQAGVTRDAKYRVTEWGGRRFTLVDTGGVFGPDEDPFSDLVQERIEMEIETALVVVFLLDASSGPTATDHDVVDYLRRRRVYVIGVVNKVDNLSKVEELIAPFYELGLESLHPISAVQGLGTGDLLDEIISFIPEGLEPEPEEELPAIAIVGRPNVGKSTLLNALCGSERSMVSPMAGTTRDPVDTEIMIDDKKYLLIDTAGIRRKGKMSQGLDRYALQRAEGAIKRCDLVLLMIDGIEGLTETDAKVFGLAKDAGKAAIILVNKWDGVEKDEKTSGEFAKKVREELPFLHYAPVEFISALTKKRVHRIFPHVDRILASYEKRVPTSELNRLLEGILNRHPPPVHKGRSPRIYYWTQAEVKPPTFVAFVSDPRSIHFSYERYLINRLYETFTFEGTPIRLYLKQRGKTSKHHGP